MPSKMNASNAMFKTPILPQIAQAEALLFHDIVEEKTLALRNIMTEYLHVLPYRKFDYEFSNFIRRLRRIAEEGHRVGANVTRLPNVAQVAAVSSRPTEYCNRMPPTTSAPSSSSPNTSKLLTNAQNVKQSNPFKPPIGNGLPPKAIVRSINIPDHSTLNQVNTKTATPANHKNSKSSESTKTRTTSNTPKAHSSTTQTKKKSIPELKQNQEDDNNTIEAILGEIGSNKVIGLCNNSVNKSLRPVNQTQTNSPKVVEKYLSEWTLKMKKVKSQLGAPTFVIVLTGTLLTENKDSTLENNHDAGILAIRKEKDLVKTTNGLYRLIGNIVNGSPKKFFQAWPKVNGFPKNWKIILNQISGVEKGDKNKSVTFSSKTPTRPIKPAKAAVKLDTNTTAKSSSNKSISQKSNGKRKCPDTSNTAENKLKHKKSKQELSPLMASTPKITNKFIPCTTPTQILKFKFHQKLLKSNSKLNSEKLSAKNDSINIKKKKIDFKE